MLEAVTRSARARSPSFLLMALPVLLIGLGASFAMPYISLFGRREVSMTPLALGVYLTLVSSSSVVISTLLARHSDRMADRKGIVLLALTTAAIGYLCLAVIRTYWPLVILASVFLGLGAASFPQLFALSRNQLVSGGAEHPERGLTALRSIFSLAWVVGPLGGSLLLERLGFSGLFLGTAACYVIAALPVLLLRSRPLPEASAEPTGLSEVTAAPRAIAAVTLCFVLYNMANSMGMSWLPIQVTETLHRPTGDVGFLVGLCALLEIPTMLGLAFLRRRPSNEHLILLSFGLCALYYVMLSKASGMAILVVAQAVRAVFVAISATIGMAYFQDLMPGRTGTAITMFSNTMSLGAMLAGVVAGGVVQALGLQAVFVLCAALAGLACGLLLFVTRRASQPG